MPGTGRGPVGTGRQEPQTGNERDGPRSTPHEQALGLIPDADSAAGLNADVVSNPLGPGPVGRYHP